MINKKFETVLLQFKLENLQVKGPNNKELLINIKS